ncbi:MAG: hypothetical protein OJJ54_22895 [Pseudonocardia sp.]|nr:hypothetical protein [Pseudonocardia sp.]
MLRRRPMRPERRRPGDVVAAVAIAVALVVTAVVYGTHSPIAGTTSVPAAGPGVPPEAPLDVPAAFTEAWRAPSAAAPLPVTAGPGVVTADGDTVTGRDATTGAVRWTYSRDRQLCTVAEGFGRVLALYRDGDRCSELAALDGDLGSRRDQRTVDGRPGARLLTTGSQVVLTGTDHTEAMRSDLVKTLEYGAISAPAQPGRQPRSGCTYHSFASTTARLGVVETCPTDTADRITVLRPDGGGDSDTPKVVFSSQLPTTGAQVIALSPERTAVVLPGPPELQVLDSQGAQVALLGLDVPESDVAAPADGLAVTSSDTQRIFWWSGTATVTLERTALTPLWTLKNTLGPGTGYAGQWLVPVPAGLAVLDPARGVVRRTIPVDRGGYSGPVMLAAKGDVLVEQRGTEAVALRPAG